MLGRRTLSWLGRRHRKLLREQSSACSKEGLSVLRAPFYEAQCLTARPITTEASTIKVEELTIPMPWGDIAAKKWTSTETESSEENVRKRPLVALHGWLDNAASYDGLAPLLPLTRYDLISLDLPGL